MKQISVICIDCESNFIDNTLLAQTYKNLEIVETQTGADFYKDISEYCEQTDSEYICFFKKRQNIWNMLILYCVIEII